MIGYAILISLRFACPSFKEGQYFVLHTVGRADPAPTAVVDALFFIAHCAARELLFARCKTSSKLVFYSLNQHFDNTRF